MKCKYNSTEHQISSDGGVTWITVDVEKGSLIEVQSQDCPDDSYESRWVVIEGVYLCEGDIKYEAEAYQVSYDGGVSWYFSTPYIYRLGQVIGSDSQFCNNKFEGHYIAEAVQYIVDPLKIVACSDDLKLTHADVLYDSERGYSFRLSSCTIGDCVSSITSNAFNAGGKSNMVSVNMGKNIVVIQSNAFQSCTALPNITLPNSLEIIGSSGFSNCTVLSRINSSENGTYSLPSGITNIGSVVFSGNPLVNKIVMNALTPPSINRDTFDGTNDCDIYVPCESYYRYRSAENWTYYYDRIKTTEGCPVEFKVTFYDRNGDFYTFPCNTSQTLTYEEYFGYDIPYDDMIRADVGECVRTLGEGALAGFHNLSSVTVPNTVITIGDYAFGATKIPDITLPNVRYFGASSFAGSSALTSVTVLSSGISIGEQSFASCPNLTTFNGNITGIGTQGFSRCYSLTSINVDNAGMFSSSCFLECSGLTELTMTNAAYIDGGAFQRCSHLSSVTFGTKVYNIGRSAFQECTRLRSVTIYRTTPPTLGQYAFSQTSSNLRIYVPSEAVQAYRNAEMWRTMDWRIEAISE